MDFPILILSFPHTLLLCHMLDFFNTFPSSLNPDQAQHFGSKLFAKAISSQQKLPLEGKELNTKQLVETTLAKTLAKVNFI